MKTHYLACATIAALSMIITSPARAAAGDSEWQKVKAVMQSVRQPKERPKSRDEAIGRMKQGLQDFDAAYATAMAADPKNPLRWEAALFNSMVSRTRPIVGLPAQEKTSITLDDIAQAPDAPAEIKAEASGISLMTAAEAADAPGGDITGWISRAEQHLKSYPGQRINTAIESKIASFKATAELKTKPLDLKFTAVDGREVDLAKLRGKVVLIDFWATWCGPCVDELPNVLSAYKKLHPKGFEIVGISLDSDQEKLKAFVKDKGMEWPQFFDGKGWQNEIASRYGIHSIPAMWLVNKEGMVASTSARAGLEEAVAKLLEE